MKKKLLSLGCALLGCVLSAFCLSAQNNGEIIIVVQQDEPITPPGAPRSPEYNPFFAELVWNSVLLGSMNSCGSVSVEIASTAGDNYSVYFDTTTGMILLPISGNPGDYTIRITTPMGVHYIGEFTI